MRGRADSTREQGSRLLGLCRVDHERQGFGLASTFKLHAQQPPHGRVDCVVHRQSQVCRTLCGDQQTRVGAGHVVGMKECGHSARRQRVDHGHVGQRVESGLGPGWRGAVVPMDSSPKKGELSSQSKPPSAWAYAVIKICIEYSVMGSWWSQRFYNE